MDGVPIHIFRTGDQYRDYRWLAVGIGIMSILTVIGTGAVVNLSGTPNTVNPKSALGHRTDTSLPTLRSALVPAPRGSR